MCITKANSPVWLGGSILVFFISDYTSQNTFMIKADVSALIQAPSSVQWQNTDKNWCIKERRGWSLIQEVRIFLYDVQLKFVDRYTTKQCKKSSVNSLTNHLKYIYQEHWNLIGQYQVTKSHRNLRLKYISIVEYFPLDVYSYRMVGNFRESRAIREN